MLDYWFGNCGAPGEALAAVGQMILELRASYSAACPEIAELRCVQLDDCVFLLRISLLRARRDAPPPLFLRLDGQNVGESAWLPAPASSRAPQQSGPRLADAADVATTRAAWGASARPPHSRGN